MRQMQPVLWTKGVLLSPQHLQTQDRFLEDLLQFQLSTLTYSPWGFARLEIDREALATGSLRVSAASGIFPDGLLFDIPGADAPPPPKVLEGAWDPDQKTLDVHLAIPEYHVGGHNVAAHQDRGTRYQADILLRRDENSGLAEKPIQVARKNFRLLTEGESLDGSATLRIARIRRSETGEYQLDPRFSPPLVDISGSEYILAIARRLIEILSAKSSTLSGMRRQKNQSLADFSIADVASFWLLYTVNTHLPLLRHIFETRRGHPSELYSAMLALAGSLTTFSPTIHPRQLPAYEHDDPAACFTTLDEQLRQLLETVVPANVVSLPLRVVQPSVHATALDQDKYLAAPQIYLAMSSTSRQPEIWERAPQVLKIGSGDRIEHLIRQALPGLPLAYVASPPGAVPIKTNFHYYQVNKTGREWDAIAAARNLAVYVPEDYPGAQLELVILMPTR